MDCHAERSEAGEVILGDKLRALGLPSLKHIVFHRNRVVLLTFSRGVLRLHEGYASAPDDVLRAIARFLSPSTRRRDRLAARRTFIGFPVEQHAPSHGPAEPPSRPLAALGASYAAEPPSRRAAEPDRPWIQRLRAEHARLNTERFGGELGELPIRLSGHMRRRLGHVMLSRETGAAVEIAMNRRHVQRDPWPQVEDTLLHEMVHQWQAETGRRVDHGAEFRRKLSQVTSRRPQKA
ncbi:MAG TPA: SprT-like domain-containing protein [Gemmatimonadales bacterium]|nr:SprT-like domain-containing protein [Gemmatimonadales bacterium]